MTRNRLFKIVLVVLLLADTVYTFNQHVHLPLDGDLAAGVVETPEIKQILDDPFAIKVLLHNKRYPNPNRFFSHWMLSAYFRTVPFVVQHFASPIDSLYIAAALAKTMIQLLMVLLLAMFSTGSKNIFGTWNVLAALCIAPFFQVTGFASQMAMIDHAITYNFFYSLPLLLLLLFFLPFYLSKNNPIPMAVKFLLMILCMVLPFSGPLIPGILLIVWSMVLVVMYRQQGSWHHVLRPIPVSTQFFFWQVFVLSLYSLFIGMNNSIQLEEYVPVWKRYFLLPVGLLKILTAKSGFALLLGLVCLNLFYIRKKIFSSEKEKILRWFNWILVFSALYVLLLPLGGHRPYRPYTLRYDTIMPVTVAFIFLYAWSVRLILQNALQKGKILFAFVFASVGLLYTVVDQHPGNENTEEKMALQILSVSNEKIVHLDQWGKVLAWTCVEEYRDSQVNAAFLQLMGVTTELRLYDQPCYYIGMNE